MAQFVDTENIIKRNIKGIFKRFTYYLETGGRKITSYVYCHYYENLPIIKIELVEG